MTSEVGVMTIIQVDTKHRSKAWNLLIRHSPGTALPNEIYVISDEAVKALRRAKIKFKIIAKHPPSPPALTNGVVKGERI